MKKIQDYELIIFDCDGVLLNSNTIKSNAFKYACSNFGEFYSNKFVEYHKRNGGVSRYKKFQYFIREILKKDFDQELYEDLLIKYSQYVKRELINCEVAEKLSELKKITKNSDWMVASGGNQNELREVFKQKEIHSYFEHGIYGSPKTKEQIFKNKLNKFTKDAVIFIGDSEYDYIVSKKFSIDFIFLTKWTEFKEWNSFCVANKINHLQDLKSLLD